MRASVTARTGKMNGAFQFSVIGTGRDRVARFVSPFVNPHLLPGETEHFGHEGQTGRPTPFVERSEDLFGAADAHSISRSQLRFGLAMRHLNASLGTASG
ncbi:MULTISPECIES: hypothetical protein [unclassified Amycolatopsis]|uniref:hypothetical protein n=1 Tax=unclassified Amycolatopsis TaxID=2618356 RepID=UPI001F1109F0|nr:MULTISPECIES: hypothetical protein [unclassified Amycolatopsis]